jgi:hypothetical protein
MQFLMFLHSINHAQLASEVTGAEDSVFGIGKQYQQHFSKHSCHADFLWWRQTSEFVET